MGELQEELQEEVAELQEEMRLQQVIQRPPPAALYCCTLIVHSALALCSCTLLLRSARALCSCALLLIPARGLQRQQQRETAAILARLEAAEAEADELAAEVEDRAEAAAGLAARHH